ncbi:hypothetical protein FDP41_001028 [Naegleria fowleri]|uniref:FAD-binding domain-containing protein n=1 Tax=Naegleria fowleri TaxID=5763 RepID=A0A6A5C2Z1_NAEFO|nr:uncharacterized protein FDP41_001028 [Naegleria fowleri]KAF0979875.1 hypothetical protein FDP41_001028 [Naegleria fowleri]CAG4714581.1 unnamed protein product [Naegleria fowleri]
MPLVTHTSTDISSNRYFGEQDDIEEPTSEHNDLFSSLPQPLSTLHHHYQAASRSASMITNHQTPSMFHCDGGLETDDHPHHGHTFKILISGGGFAGLVAAYYLLNHTNQFATNYHGNLPIEITIVEKASMYRQVGAVITLEGDQVLRTLKEMNIEEELSSIEIPRTKQHFFTHNGRHVRSFDESSVSKYKEEGRRYERHKFHEILMKRIKPMIVRRDGNVTVLTNVGGNGADSNHENYDDNHFRMNRVIYSMRPSLFNKDKIEVTLMRKTDWLHLQNQKETQTLRKTQIPRKALDCSNLDEKKETPMNRLSKLQKRKSTGSSGDLQQLEEAAIEKEKQQTTPVGKESPGWRRFFQKKEILAQSPATTRKETPCSSPSSVTTHTNRTNSSESPLQVRDRSTSMRDLFITFNDGEDFENAVYQTMEDRKLYNIEKEEFDLVIGADGIHSQTRALIFGDESNFKHFLGVGYFCFIVDLVLCEDDMQKISEKYWSNVYGDAKKLSSTESFDPAQINSIPGLESLTPERLSRMLEASKKIAEHVKDTESASVLLTNGRYLNVLRYGSKIAVTCVNREPSEEEMEKDSQVYSVGINKSFVDESQQEKRMTVSMNDLGKHEKHESIPEKLRKRFSLFKKTTPETHSKHDTSNHNPSITNQFYSFDASKMHDYHFDNTLTHDSSSSSLHTSSGDSTETDHEEEMYEEDEEIAEAFMEMVNESVAAKQSMTPNTDNTVDATTQHQLSSTEHFKEVECSATSNESTSKKKKQDKSHHSKTFFISAEKRKTFLKEKFKDCEFLFHDIMELVLDSRTIYYDDLAQIRNLDKWHKGRCVLVGDACQALTPLSGKGGALAIIAAKKLGQELRTALEIHASKEGEENLHTIPLERSVFFGSCLETAFNNYQSAMQERIKQVQKKTVWEGVDVFLAKSSVKRMVRDGALRFLPKSVLLKMTKKEEESY